MSQDKLPEPMSEAETRRPLLRDALRQAAMPSTANSPTALDAMLARISAEVTQEAGEREHRATPPNKA